MDADCADAAALRQCQSGIILRLLYYIRFFRKNKEFIYPNFYFSNCALCIIFYKNTETSNFPTPVLF